MHMTCKISKLFGHRPAPKHIPEGLNPTQRLTPAGLHGYSQELWGLGLGVWGLGFRVFLEVMVKPKMAMHARLNFLTKPALTGWVGFSVEDLAFGPSGG